MKERMRRLIVVLTLFLCITAAASADMIWVGYGNGVWDGSLNNWFDTDTSALATYFPTLSTNVPMPMPACTIGATTNAQANILWIAPWGGNPGNLTMNGGTLQTANNLWVGSQANGTFNLNGGVVTVGTQIMLGANGGTNGYMTMNGGTVNITSEGLFMGGNGYGQLDMYGGDIVTPGIGFGVWGAGSGMVNFHNGGQITILGTSQQADVEFWMQDGEINGAMLDVVNGNIVLTPEPATLALLGIGSLVALKRRK